LADGSKFPLRVLINFMRRGEAFTRSGVEPLPQREAEHPTYDFHDDQFAENLMPTCSVTGAFDDLHLVVWQQGSTSEAQLLSTVPRNKLQHAVSLSIPLPLLSLQALKNLQKMDKIPPSEDIQFLRAWYQHDNDAQWDVIRQRRARESRQMLLLKDEGERSLFNYA
ncbi:MAG: hypothetical protein ABI210_15345, partial [Abditibacteriaceae bacterium]